MRNSIPEEGIYLGESGSEDEDDERGDEEEGIGAYESDPSDSESNGTPRGSRPSSYTNAWPQSYRQSIDMYTSVTPTSRGFLGTPPLARLSSSFLTTSFQGKHTPEIITSLLKPLLPSTPPPPQQQEEETEEKKSSYNLLPPSVPTRRRSSRIKIDEDVHRLGKVSHHEVVASPRQYTSTQGVLNGINVLCGVGILSTPYAVKEGGWLGLLVLFVFAVLAWYTGTLLRTCLDSEPGLETYPDIGQAAFGTKGRIMVSVILYLELYACCVEYIILESDNLSSLFPGAQLSFAGFRLNSHLLFAILTTLVVMPTTWLRDLSVLSYISAFGVIASILVVVCLFWVGVFDNVGFHHKGTALSLPTFPIAVGLYGYCYSGHAVFPNIYSSLKKPNQFSSVLFACFALCTVLFAGAAAIGYTMFGEATESQFTLNLPKHLVASKVAVWTTVVNPITKYALTLTPLALSLEELIPARFGKSHLHAIIIRSALTVSTLIVALSVPFFGLVMSLVGSFFTMIVSFILPCVCFLSIVKGRVSWFQGSLCVFIIIVGVISCIFGTYSSVSKIIQSLG